MQGDPVNEMIFPLSPSGGSDPPSRTSRVSIPPYFPHTPSLLPLLYGVQLLVAQPGVWIEGAEGSIALTRTEMNLKQVCLIGHIHDHARCLAGDGRHDS